MGRVHISPVAALAGLASHGYAKGLLVVPVWPLGLLKRSLLGGALFLLVLGCSRETNSSDALVAELDPSADMAQINEDLQDLSQEQRLASLCRMYRDAERALDRTKAVKLLAEWISRGQAGLPDSVRPQVQRVAREAFLELPRSQLGPAIGLVFRADAPDVPDLVKRRLDTQRGGRTAQTEILLLLTSMLESDVVDRDAVRDTLLAELDTNPPDPSDALARKAWADRMFAVVTALDNADRHGFSLSKATLRKVGDLLRTEPRVASQAVPLLVRHSSPQARDALLAAMLKHGSTAAVMPLAGGLMALDVQRDRYRQWFLDTLDKGLKRYAAAEDFEDMLYLRMVIQWASFAAAKTEDARMLAHILSAVRSLKQDHLESVMLGVSAYEAEVPATVVKAFAALPEGELRHLLTSSHVAWGTLTEALKTLEHLHSTKKVTSSVEASTIARLHTVLAETKRQDSSSGN